MPHNGRIVGVGDIGNVNIIPTRLVSIDATIRSRHDLHFGISGTGQFIEICELNIRTAHVVLRRVPVIMVLTLNQGVVSHRH